MSYRKIGEIIQLVDQRNKDLAINTLVGLSINKKFIPSVANTIGTDMSNYKIIRKNQFACSTMQVRRDKKMPVALLKDLEIAIVSQAYPVFEVVDENSVLPEYLMLWFTRSEFDREACFHAVGGVRGSLEWEDFSTMELPIPSIEKQREVVAQFEAVTNKIKVNEAICKKLEATAQALYKHWFVDFEFPNENGQPYKSSGGVMVFNQELEKEIPEGWEVKSLGEICEVINGRAYLDGEFVESGTPIIRIQNLNGGKKFVYSEMNLSEDKYISNGDLIFAWSATFGPFIWRGEKSIYHYHIWKMKVYDPNFKFPLYHYLLRETNRVSGEGSGSIFAHITKGLIESQKLIISSEHILQLANSFLSKFDYYLENRIKQNQKLTQLQSLLLSRLATM